MWKAQTLIALEHQEVLDFIKSPSSRPAPIVLSPGDKAEDRSSQRSGYRIANADDMVAWDRGNCVARMQVFMTLGHAVADLFDDKTVALELWDALHACFEGKGLVAVAALAACLW